MLLRFTLANKSNLGLLSYFFTYLLNEHLYSQIADTMQYIYPRDKISVKHEKTDKQTDRQKMYK